MHEIISGLRRAAEGSSVPTIGIGNTGEGMSSLGGYDYPYP